MRRENEKRSVISVKVPIFMRRSVESKANTKGQDISEVDGETFSQWSEMLSYSDIKMRKKVKRIAKIRRMTLFEAEKAVFKC